MTHMTMRRNVLERTGSAMTFRRLRRLSISVYPRSACNTFCIRIPECKITS